MQIYGNIGIGTTTINTGTLGTSNKFLEVAAGTASGSGTLVLSRDTSGNDNEVGGIRFVNANNADDDGLDADGKFVAAIAARSVTSDSNASDDSGANLAFYTKPEAGNYAERMRITSAGKVMMGRTAQINSSLLSVDDGGVGITYAGAPSNYYRQMYQSSSGNFFFYNGNNQSYIDQSGSFNDASDERIKKDIEDIDYGLDTIKALKPRKYKMKLNDSEQIGFIAQEVESLIPEVVDTGETPDGEEQKGMSYGHLTAVLTKAIQELSAKVEELESKINE